MFNLGMVSQQYELDRNRIERHLPDDHRLRLMFACCHPALEEHIQLALTLRTLGGLAAPEIARALLLPEDSLRRKLARGEAQLSQLPGSIEISSTTMRERLPSVRRGIYLIFNEGYSATFGRDLIRTDLCAEAIRLGRILCALVPEDSDSEALLALMLLQDSRRNARVDVAGELVTLENQDRTLMK